jgi:hypothetical protein
MIKVCALLLFPLLLATSCSTPRTARVERFTEQDQASLIVRYYTDDTSYLLKPAANEGPFLAVLNKDAVMDVAKQQPGRQLAVVIMIQHANQNEVDAVRQRWQGLLTQAGYQRVVFLRARKGWDVNGLPVLAKGG